MSFEFSWFGDELEVRTLRAMGRAAIGIGEDTAAEMKRVCHVISGDLEHSIHAAGAHTIEGDPVANEENVIDGFEAIVEVGSWLPYACVEENRGGTHRFATIGYEAAAPRGFLKIAEAFRQEGL